jgi:hypothetical protein
MRCLSPSGNSNLAVLNENTPTRLPSNGQATSPDISLSSISLITSTEWETVTSLGSDHLPILIKIGSTIKPIKNDFRNFINFNLADWPEYQNITEAQFLKLLNEPIQTTRNISKEEKAFRKVINKAANKTIPGGRIKDIIPEIPSITARKIKSRDELRKNNPESPDLAVLNRDILSEISGHRNHKWRDKVENIKCSSKLLKLVKNLNGKNEASPNETIKFKGKILSSPGDISSAFNEQYSSVVKHKSSKFSRVISKQIKKNKFDDATTFTTEQTKEAIKSAKPSKAAGPDNITNLHLKHLGPNGIKYLTRIFNLSMSTGIIPDIWKTSTIIPLLQPNKPSNESNSYRPVSLLCPAIKILERLILPTLTESLDIPVFQHGFRKDHSTVTALNDFNADVTNGFNEKSSKRPDRTVLLQIDLSKAFDMVNHDKLIADLDESELPSHLKRWFSNYLRGRQSKVNFRNTLSSSRNVRAGVPQGAVTSPILFNFYLRNLPRPPDSIKVIQYADDISIYATGKSIVELTQSINVYTPQVLTFLKERELKVSPEKSTVTLFTPDKREANIHPQVKIHDVLVPLEKNPKLLGVTFDTTYTFSTHIKLAANKSKFKINLMKSIAGSTWGQDKETLTMTYKAIGRSVLEYGAPIWSPIISNASWSKLQIAQNQAIRIITGNLKMASEEHLHRESKILPIKEHCKMISKQFLLTCHQPHHPGFKHISKPLPPRNMKPTIQNYRRDVRNLLPVTDKKDLKTKIKTIHTTEVAKTILSYPPNKVLKADPPKISKEENTLSRNSRSLLSQLRSGYSRILNSYKHRIDPNTANNCGLCSGTPHDSKHLFNCPRNPTDLSISDLWSKPVQTANFLKLDEGIT